MSGNRRARANRLSSEEALVGRPIQQLLAAHRLQLQQGPRSEPSADLHAPRRSPPGARQEGRECCSAASPSEAGRPLAASGAQMPAEGAQRPGPPAQVPRRRRVLKLTDDEILSLYHDAQQEAAIEADWRGIQVPTASRGSSDGGGTSRSSAARGPAESCCQQECLRMLSRALQQPGRSPRELAAQILDPSRDRVCCQPHVDAILDSDLGRPWSCTDEVGGPGSK